MRVLGNFALSRCFHKSGTPSLERCAVTIAEVQANDSTINARSSAKSKSNRFIIKGFCGITDYSSGANIGSQAGSIVGFCLSISRISCGTYLRSTTRRNIYSLNHSSVMMRLPL